MKLEPLQEMKRIPKSSLESVAVACAQNALQNFWKYAFCRDTFCIWACRTICSINTSQKGIK
jgi:hypothetical protein